MKIACVNDITTAQGGTTEAFARLMAVIVLDSVLGKESHDRMRKLLQDAAHGAEPFLLARIELPNALKNNQVIFGKIGRGPQKTGNIIFSEACWLTDIVQAGKSYIVAYANIDWKPYTLADIITVIKSAIGIYEAGRPASIDSEPHL